MNKKSSDETQLTDKRPGIGGKPATNPGDYSGAIAVATANTANVTVPFRASLAYPGKPDLEFSDLSDEQYRVYEWPDGSAIRLDNPMKLNVSKSGGHRVYTTDGISHYIPSGWNHLSWKVKENCPHFTF